MPFLALEMRMPWISFENNTMRYVCSHKHSTFLRESPTKGPCKIFQFPCMPALWEKWFCFAGFESAISYIHYDMCPSSPKSIWLTDPDALPPHNPTMVVLIMSPAFSQSKPWHAQSSIVKLLTEFKNSLFLRTYPSPVSSYPLAQISRMSIPKTSSQTCAPQFISSDGYLYSCGRACGGQRLIWQELWS